MAAEDRGSFEGTDMIRGVMTLTALAMMMSSAHADIPKGAPIEVPMPVVAPPPPPKPAPPLPPTPKVRAVPSASPGSWVTSDDYPASALRMSLEGKVGIRLFVDSAGKVSHCQIISSSNFQILDDAACELISRRGEFVPAKDRKGRAVADVWTSRFVWRIPDTASEIVEYSGGYSLVINKMGLIVDCTMKMKVAAIEKDDGQCPSLSGMPRVAALEMRGYGEAEAVEAVVEMSQALSPESRDKLFGYRAGYEERSLLVFKVETDATGKVAHCVLERQKGSSALMRDVCSGNYNQSFLPTKDASGKPAPITFWYVERVLRKLTP